LKYHKQLKGFKTKVLLTFRPELKEINEDITERMDYFEEIGCKFSDHSVDEMNDDVIEKLTFWEKSTQNEAG
jgi:glucuronate isomerase